MAHKRGKGKKKGGKIEPFPEALKRVEVLARRLNRKVERAVAIQTTPEEEKEFHSILVEHGKFAIPFRCEGEVVICFMPIGIEKEVKEKFKGVPYEKRRRLYFHLLRDLQLSNRVGYTIKPLGIKLIDQIDEVYLECSSIIEDTSGESANRLADIIQEMVIMMLKAGKYFGGEEEKSDSKPDTFTVMYHQ